MEKPVLTTPKRTILNVHAKKNQVKGNPQMNKMKLCNESEEIDNQYKYIETVLKLDTVSVATLNSHDDTKLFSNMCIQKIIVRFQIDTRATVNVIPNKCKIEPTATKLKMYSNTILTTKGNTRIPMQNLKTTENTVEDIVVNGEKIPTVLGYMQPNR